MRAVVLFCLCGLLSLNAQRVPIEGGFLTALGGQGLNGARIAASGGTPLDAVAVGNDTAKAILTGSAIWSQTGTGVFQVLVANGDKRLEGTVLEGAGNPGISVGSNGAVYFDSFNQNTLKGSASWRASGGSITKLLASGLQGTVKLPSGGQSAGNIISVSQAYEAPDGTLYLALEFGSDAQTATEWFICSLASDGTLTAVVHDTVATSVPGNPGLAIGVRFTHQVLTFVGTSMFFWRNQQLSKVDLRTRVETPIIQYQKTTVGNTNVGELVFPGEAAFALNSQGTDIEYLGYAVDTEVAEGINGITRLLHANANGTWQIPPLKVANIQTDAMIDIVRLDDQTVVLPYVTHLNNGSPWKAEVPQQLLRFDGVNFPGKPFAKEAAALPDGITPTTFPVYVGETCGFWFVAADANGYALGTYRYSSVCPTAVSELQGISTLTGNNFSGMTLLIDGAAYPTLSADDTTMTFLTPAKGSHTLQLVDATGTVKSKVLDFTSQGTALVAPTVISFTAQPAAIHTGESSNLCWVIQGTVQGTTLDQNIGSVQPYIGCQSVSPATTTTYTLTTTGTNGVTTKATVLVTVNPGPYFVPQGVVESATSTNPCSPGGLCTLYGLNLAASMEQAASLPLPNTLGGARVLINGVAAPLVYVSPTQINLQLPLEVTGSNMTVQVTNVQASSVVTVPIVPAGPGVFTNQATGRAFVQDPLTGDLVDPKVGQVVTVFVTGLGVTVCDDVITGQASPLKACAAVINPTVKFGSQVAQISYAGLTPMFVGLYQINVTVPNEPGDITLTVGDMGMESIAKVRVIQQ